MYIYIYIYIQVVAQQEIAGERLCFRLLEA